MLDLTALFARRDEMTLSEANVDYGGFLSAVVVARLQSESCIVALVLPYVRYVALFNIYILMFGCLGNGFVEAANK